MPNGLFWTVPIMPDAIEMNLAAGTARFHMTDMAIPDFHDFANSIGSAKPPIPTSQASATFDVRWQARTPAIPLSDPVAGYAGDFRDSQATISWSVEQPSQHFRFVTDNAATKTVGGVMGRERNGTYFHAIRGLSM